jgi:nucleotide-binding universal stress UspA family protein
VLAAVDVAGAEPALLESVREAALRLLKSEPGARLACLTVMRTNRIGMDDLLEPDGTSRHVKLLVGLRHWARPLLHTVSAVAHGSDAASRITYHVLESPDPATAIVEYARRNKVDHIVLGARSSGRLRRFLGSVSSQVAAQADCTVTVVRSDSRAS